MSSHVVSRNTRQREKKWLNRNLKCICCGRVWNVSEYAVETNKDYKCPYCRARDKKEEQPNVKDTKPESAG